MLTELRKVNLLLKGRLISAVLQFVRPFHFRGKYRLLSPLVPREGTCSASVFGATFHLDVGEYIQRHVFIGSYERQETQAIAAFLKPGMTFLDIGANIGYFTALGAKLVGVTGRVVAIEPSPVAFTRLKTMVDSNGMTNVTCLNLGLSNQPGFSDLHLLEGSRNHTPSFVCQQDSRNERFTRVTVPVDTLDHVVGSLQLTEIDLIKIDVEGWEPHVFAGARQILMERRVKAIVTEINDYWLQRVGSSREHYMQQLLSLGFRDITQDTAIRHTDTRLLALG